MPVRAKFQFTVDDKHLESDVAVLTGQQIKARAGIDATFGLFIEGRGKGSDEQIADNQSVDLSKPGREKFYTAPPATYGS
jgi:hypothetical protein